MPGTITATMKLMECRRGLFLGGGGSRWGFRLYNLGSAVDLCVCVCSEQGEKLHMQSKRCAKEMREG